MFEAHGTGIFMLHRLASMHSLLDRSVQMRDNVANELIVASRSTALTEPGRRLLNASNF
jgi:hypothetical protein